MIWLRVIQMCLAIFFAISFVLIDPAMAEIERQSKDLVIAKVVSTVAPQVAIAEEALHSPKVQELFAPHQIAVMQEEVALFRQDPAVYVSTIIDEDVDLDLPKVVSQEVEDPLAAKLKQGLIAQIWSWKTSLRQHFTDSFAGLIRDLRFSPSAMSWFWF